MTQQKKKLKVRKSSGKLSPLKSVDPTDWDESEFGNWASETRALMDSRTLKSLFFSEDWVYITVDAYAQPLSTVPLRVFSRETTVNNTDAWKPVSERHKLNQMLKKPNNYQDSTQFMYSMISEYILGGNAFFFFAPKTSQMIPIGFERVSYNFSNGEPTEFLVTTGVDETFTANDKKIYNLKEICHVKRPNPASVFYGLSPFVPGRKSLLFNRYSQDYLNAFYLKGATPQWILSLDREANEMSAQRLLRSMEQAYSGRRSQRRTMLLPKGVSATAADNKIADQQLVDLINLNRETILNVLHIPKHVVGLQSAGSLGSEESKMALRYFWESAVRPTGDSIASSMSKYFREQKLLGENEELRFDYSGVMALQENLDAKANLSIQMLQSHTLNEVRAALWQLPPVSGGDAIPGSKPPVLQAIQVGPEVVANQPQTPNVSPSVTEAKALVEVPEQNQKAPYDVIDFQPTQQMADNAERGLKLRSEYGRGGTSVGVARAVQLKNRENLSPETVRRMKSFFARHQHDNLEQKDPPSNGYIAWLLWGGDEGRDWAERIVARMDRIDEMEDNEASMKALAEAEDSEAQKVEPEMVLWSLSLFTEHAKAAVEAMNVFRKKATPEEEEYLKAVEEEVARLQDEYVQRYVSILSPSVEAGYGMQARTVLDAPSRESILAAIEIDRTGRLEFLRMRGRESFEGISGTTTDAIMGIVTKGIKEGKEITAVTEEIRGYFTQQAAVRARRIARTETLTALSIGQASMMRTVASAVPDLKKLWSTQADEDVRDLHVPLHGEERNYNEPFSNGLEYPRDPRGSAQDCVNCFVGETEVSAINAEKVYRRLYKGEFVVIKTSSGSKITVTPNHPVLTTHGWIKAGEVTKGSNLVKAVVGDSSLRNDDMKIMPIMFHQVFDSFSKPDAVVSKDGCVGDFHGDGSASNVDIVDIKRELNLGIEAFAGKKSKNFSLPNSDLATSLSLGNCSANEAINIGGLSNSGSMTSSDLLSSGVDVHSAPFEQLSFASSSDFDSALEKVMSNSSSRNAELIGDLLHAHGFIDVTVDPVVDISVVELDCHVYNLQTKSGIYLAEGIVAHNCRCQLVTVFPQDVEKTRQQLASLVKR